MVSSNNSINNVVGASISGVTNSLTVKNASNTASSSARKKITVGGGSSGDASLNWNVSGTTNWEMGCDNSDSDKLKISIGTALGTNDAWTMTTDGECNLPLHPAFSAYLPTDDVNVTGNSTEYTLGNTSVAHSLTELYDVTGDFTPGAAGGAFFTAPIDGKYFLSMAVDVYNYSTKPNTTTCYIHTPLFTYRGANLWQAAFGGTPGATLSVITTLDAADIVTFTVLSGPGAKSAELERASTWVNGCLVF